MNRLTPAGHSNCAQEQAKEIFHEAKISTKQAGIASGKSNAAQDTCFFGLARFGQC
jgi:hypothetical protein